MGAAMRHAGHYLGHQQSDKKLLLILTDGEPSDIDTENLLLLIEDTAQAPRELKWVVATICGHHQYWSPTLWSSPPQLNRGVMDDP